MKTLSVAAIAMLVACTFPVLAADGLPGATAHSKPPQFSAERQARFEQWCKDNAEKCREMQARREQCQADPEKCRAKMQARSQERFKHADANGDGRLTREEAQKGMPMVARHFDQIDANKDGSVTFEELLAARKARAVNHMRPRGMRMRGATQL